MSPGTRLLSHIAEAEAHVRIARRVWDATSISACAECGEQLQRAIDQMNVACEAAGSASAAATARLQRLRSDVEELSRLVDAAIAFGRGLTLRTGGPELADSETGRYGHV